MKSITLSLAEIMVGGQAGLYRKVSSLKKNHNSAAVSADGKWDAEMEGALAEYAYCKAMGLYWGATEGSYKGADVGEDIQVRHTIREDGCLIIRPKDNPNHLYVLVTGRVPHYNIHGFMRGQDAMSNKAHMMNPGGVGAVWFIPQSCLTPIEEIWSASDRRKASEEQDV